ncbi:hypothetical protein SESBI_49126 [Sesbania bispinosa]|nr:hypothetical protein SESBI_49126 [Sesbania bispinosa]
MSNHSHEDTVSKLSEDFVSLQKDVESQKQKINDMEQKNKELEETVTGIVVRKRQRVNREVVVSSPEPEVGRGVSPVFRSSEAGDWRSYLKDFDGSVDGEIKTIWDKRFPTEFLIDTVFSKDFDRAKIKKIGLSGACSAAEAFSVRSAFLSRSVELEMKSLERQNDSLTEKLKELVENHNSKMAELEKALFESQQRVQNLNIEKVSLEEKVKNLEEKSDLSSELSKVQELHNKTPSIGGTFSHRGPFTTYG